MEEMKFIGFLVAVISLSLAFLLLPIAYFDGHAKSRWLEQARGVEIPWYEATFLRVEINSVDVP